MTSLSQPQRNPDPDPDLYKRIGLILGPMATTCSTGRRCHCQGNCLRRSEESDSFPVLIEIRASPLSPGATKRPSVHAALDLEQPRVWWLIQRALLKIKLIHELVLLNLLFYL